MRVLVQGHHLRSTQPDFHHLYRHVQRDPVKEVNIHTTWCFSPSSSVKWNS